MGTICLGEYSVHKCSLILVYLKGKLSDTRPLSCFSESLQKRLRMCRRTTLGELGSRGFLLTKVILISESRKLFVIKMHYEPIFF